MKKLLTTASCFILAAAAVHAANPVVDTKAPAANAAPAAGYTPKTKSVFAIAPASHNPFWPIGWVKMADAAPDATVAAVIPHTEDFNVTTIMLNDPPMAVINGKDMAEGEVASMPINGQSVVVQLMAVQDGRVVLRWENQNIIVYIHRDELSSSPVTASLP